VRQTLRRRSGRMRAFSGDTRGGVSSSQPVTARAVPALPAMCATWLGHALSAQPRSSRGAPARRVARGGALFPQTERTLRALSARFSGQSQRAGSQIWVRITNPRDGGQRRGLLQSALRYARGACFVCAAVARRWPGSRAISTRLPAVCGHHAALRVTAAAPRRWRRCFSMRRRSANA